MVATGTCSDTITSLQLVGTWTLQTWSRMKDKQLVWWLERGAKNFPGPPYHYLVKYIHVLDQVLAVVKLHCTGVQAVDRTHGQLWKCYLTKKSAIHTYVLYIVQGVSEKKTLRIQKLYIYVRPQTLPTKSIQLLNTLVVSKLRNAKPIFPQSF